MAGGSSQPTAWSKQGRIGCALLLTLLAAFGALGVRFFFVCNPRDRVGVSIVNAPVGTYFLSVVTESEGVIQIMDWSVKMLVPTEFHPNCVFSYGKWDDPNVRFHNHAMWKWGSRYGVVSRKTDKTWWVTWFEPSDLPIKGRGWVGGGGAVQFDLSKGKTQPLPHEQIRHLGLQDAFAPDEYK